MPLEEVVGKLDSRMAAMTNDIKSWHVLRLLSSSRRAPLAQIDESGRLGAETSINCRPRVTDVAGSYLHPHLIMAVMVVAARCQDRHYENESLSYEVVNDETIYERLEALFRNSSYT